MQSSPQASKPLVPSSAMYAGGVAAATQQISGTPSSTGMIGIGAIILKTPLGLRIIKLRPTGGAFASGKVWSMLVFHKVAIIASERFFQVRMGDIILEVEGRGSYLEKDRICACCAHPAVLRPSRRHGSGGTFSNSRHCGYQCSASSTDSLSRKLDLYDFFGTAF